MKREESRTQDTIAFDRHKPWTCWRRLMVHRFDGQSLYVVIARAD
jgi:hypothetical protein